VRAVYALYARGESAQAAIDGLRAAGIRKEQITVITPQPMEDFEFFRAERWTRMWWIACGGGLLGFTLGTWLTRMGQNAWPLVTGGMPITPWWSNLIIMFELTMLGAILATVATLLIAAGIPARWSKLLYDPEVTKGKILVGVEYPADPSVGDIVRILGAAPGGLVKTL
jgi:hypothetical protein